MRSDVQVQRVVGSDRVRVRIGDVWHEVTRPQFVALMEAGLRVLVSFEREAEERQR